MTSLTIIPVFDDPVLQKPLNNEPLWLQTENWARALGLYPLVISQPFGFQPRTDCDSPRPATVSGKEEDLAKLVAFELGRSAPADTITILSPYCPLRRREDYDESVRQLERSWVQGTVTTFYDEPDTMVYLRSGARNLWHRNDFQRPIYRLVPSIVTIKTEVFKASGTLIAGKCAAIEIPKEYSLEVRDGWDLLAAQAYLNEIILVANNGKNSHAVVG